MSNRSAAPDAAAPLGVQAVAVAVAAPDTPAITRERALRYQTGRQLQGVSGTVVGYDRGDPANSITTVIPSPADGMPTHAYARLGMADGIILTQPQIYDNASNDEQLTAYEQATLARIAR